LPSDVLILKIIVYIPVSKMRLPLDAAERSTAAPTCTPLELIVIAAEVIVAPEAELNAIFHKNVPVVPASPNKALSETVRDVLAPAVIIIPFDVPRAAGTSPVLNAVTTRLYVPLTRITGSVLSVALLRVTVRFAPPLTAVKASE
jgi:hypothetical protein